MTFGFRQRFKRPTPEDIRREAAAVLAARIAEGRPPADAWLPRPPATNRRRPGGRRAPPIVRATWYVSGASSPAVTHSAPVRIAPGVEGKGYDRPAPARALTASRPLEVKVLPSGRGARTATAETRIAGACGAPD